MRFALPGFLILLLCIPLMVYYFKLILKLNLKRREKVFSNRNYAALANFSSRSNTAVKITLYLAAAALVVFAAARPQGLDKPEEVEANSIDICFALDVSESMKAMDLGRDNRLDITKAVVSHLMDNLKSDRVAIVAFAGDASCICPLTLDHAAAKSLLMQADFDLMDKGGTRVDLALKTASERFNKDDEAAKVIVLFTDGEDHDGRPVEAAREAYKNGIIIHSVGIGSKSGVKIPVSYDVWGAPVYKKFNGKDVVTKLNEQVLKDISAAAGGDYFHVSDQNSLLKMISGLKSIKKRALRVTSLSVAEELFAYFAFIALLLFIADSLIPARSLRVGSGIILLTAVLLLLCAAGTFERASAEIALPPVKSDYDSLTPAISRYSNKGADLYEKKNFGAAESEFQSSKILKPFDIVSNYNIGCARYKNRDYKGAIEAFGAAAKADARNERFEPYYNMGNAHFKLSDYKNAIASYEQALKINPDDEDTKHNLEAARKKLEEELKKNQREQKDDKNSESADKKDGGEGESKEKQNRDSAQSDKNGQQGADSDKSEQAGQKPQNQNESGSQEKQTETGRKQEGESGKPQDGKDGNGQGEKAVENLADRQNIEKYKNIQIDPNRLKMFLKDLENDEARVQHLYQRNKKRMNKAGDDDEMDIFEMDPQRLHERMRRQMLGEQDPLAGPKKNKAPSNKKDW